MPVVLVEKQTPQITVVTLNRPERRNALTIELMNELIAAIESAAADPAQRILILRGAGKAFCTGLDLQEAAKAEPHVTAETVARTLLALAETRLITIATVHGAAVAGGAGIMSACDFVIAAERTKIGYPEVRRGLVAALVMTFLRRQVRDLFGPSRDGDMVQALAIVGDEGGTDLDDQASCLLDDGIHGRVKSGCVGIIKGAMGALCEMSIQPSR